MKKVIVLLLVCVMLLSLTACQQSRVRNFGGEMTMELPVNQKLEFITWKDNDLWILTKPMVADDIAETYTFQESSLYGVLEGTVTIVEIKK